MTGIAIPQKQPQFTRAFAALVVLAAMIVAGFALANRGINITGTASTATSGSAAQSYRAHVASERALAVDQSMVNLQASERALAAARIAAYAQIGADESLMDHTSSERALVASQAAANASYWAHVNSERALSGPAVEEPRLGDDESYLGLIAAERALPVQNLTDGDRDPSDGPLPLTVGPVAR